MAGRGPGHAQALWRHIDLQVRLAAPQQALFGQALAQAVQDRPIVFASVTDPVAAGLVESMEKPGGNVTGVSDLASIDDRVIC